MINKDRPRPRIATPGASVNFLVMTLLLFAGFLAHGMLVVTEVGRRIGVAHVARDPEGLPKGVGAAEAAVFALLGLLLAFSFSGAASRFEARRHLITTKTNAIGTAYLRIDMLPKDAQLRLREMFPPVRGCRGWNVPQRAWTSGRDHGEPCGGRSHSRDEIWTKPSSEVLTSGSAAASRHAASFPH